jgi:RimJ/RimL family protein N-acetyltransferase
VSVPTRDADLPPEQVDAGPVILRRIRATDAGAVAAAVGASLDHLRPWMPWATTDAAERGSQLARVAEADEMWESGISFIYSVLTASQGTLVGEVGLHRRAGDGSVEIGYWIAGSQAGQGFGTSAAGAVTEVALDLPGVRRAEIHCDEANAASAAIPRKLGYRLDRIEERTPEAPGESGRLMIWICERPLVTGSGRRRP